MKQIQEIRDIIKENGYSVAQIAREAGVIYGRLDSWVRDRAKPKADDLAKLQKWISNFKGIPEKNELTEAHEGAVPSQSLLEKLIDSNHLLAQATNTKAEADKINAEANLRIVANAERLTNMVQSNLNAVGGNNEVALSIRAELLELQAQMRLKDGLSKSLGEARSEVNTAFFEVRKDRSEGRNVPDAGKSDKKIPV